MTSLFLVNIKPVRTSALLWFGCKIASTGSCVLALDHWLVVLFWESVKPLKEVSWRREVLGVIVQPHFCSTLFVSLSSEM